MGWFKGHFVFWGSVVAVIASIFWGVSEGGFEPWIVALLGVVGIVANSAHIPFLGGVNWSLSPEEKIALRDKWRPKFESYFLEMAKHDYVGDAIIHDIDRLDTYPNTDETKGISSWFRVGLMGTYHKGILLGLRWTQIRESGGGWIEDPRGEGKDAIKVMLLGEVPYECIESVNFDGDDFYNKPHIFCHFGFKGEPYERLYYGEQFQLKPGLPYHYTEVAEFGRDQISLRERIAKRIPKLFGARSRQ